MDDKKRFFSGFDDDILDPEDFEEEDDVETIEAKEVGDNTDNSEEPETPETSEDDEPSGTGDEDEEEEEEEEENEEDAAKAAEAAKNAEFARRRREKEAREREAREAQIKKEAKIEAELGLIKTNPYTNEPIKDTEDLEVYKIMKAIDDSGGDPIADLPSKMAELNRERAAAERAERDKQEANSKKLKEETAELHSAYPDLNLAELGKDEEFLDLCEKKGGRWTMLECYEYLMTKRVEVKTTEQNDEVVAKGGKKVTRTPSASSNGGKRSPEDFLEMTDDEFVKLQKNNGDFF